MQLISLKVYFLRNQSYRDKSANQKQVLDQHTELDFYSASSLKQQSADRHVAPLGHIILIPSRPFFALFPQCCVLTREAKISICIVFGMTRPGLDPTIYSTRGEHSNHYATDAVRIIRSCIDAAETHIHVIKGTSRPFNFQDVFFWNFFLLIMS